MIFSQRDNAEMRKAVHFLWISDTQFIPYDMVLDRLVIEYDMSYDLFKAIDNIKNIDRR